MLTLGQLRTLLPPGCTPRPSSAPPIFRAHNLHAPSSIPLHSPAAKDACRISRASWQTWCHASDSSTAPSLASEQQGQQSHPPVILRNLNNEQQLRTEKGRRTKRGRLDEVCMGLAPHLSRNVVQSYILQGKVRVDGRVVGKAGTAVPLSAKVEIDAEEPKYVCRAGHKLEAGLAAFGINPKGFVCLDSGISTGGFTDCLLQQGAAHVYGIDVAYGQVANRVRQDERVTLLERFNVRHLTPDDIPAKVDLATLDLSFISVLKVLPAVVSVMRGSPAESQGHGNSTLHEQQQQGQQQGQLQEDEHGGPANLFSQQPLQPPADSALASDLQAQRSENHSREGRQPQETWPSRKVQQSQGAPEPQQEAHNTQQPHEVQRSLEAQPTNYAHTAEQQQQQQQLQEQRPPAQLLVLVKPQFEAGRGQVCSGGVVRDPQVHLEVLTRITQGVEALGFGCQGIIESPLKGDKSGNTEFLAHYVRGMPTRVSEISLLTAEGHKRKKAKEPVEL